MDPYSEKRDVNALHYLLVEIASSLRLEPEILIPKLRKEGTNVSDHIAAHCMTAICESVDPSYIVESNKELEGMHHFDLPELWAKSKERPDIIVYTNCNGNKTNIAVVAKVRSPPMIHMERKATFGAACLLRLLCCLNHCWPLLMAF